MDHVAAHAMEPLADVSEAVEAALARPLSSLQLNMQCHPGSRVTVVCADPNYDPDAADDVFVPALIAELKSAGVHDEDITLLSATGLRRRSSEAEQYLHLGGAVVRRYPILNHDPNDVRENDDLGMFDNVPVSVNYHAVEADLLIATGVVRPHVYAGYTGGSKVVATGCAGAPTIRELTSPRFLDDPSVRPGSVSENAFQRAIREIGHRAGLGFVLNGVIDPDGGVVAVAAGAPNAVHDRLVEYARDIYEVEAPREAYNVIVGSAQGGHDLYSASCDVAFITAQREGMLAKGGVLMLPTGAGSVRRHDGVDASERQRFYDILANATDMDGVLHQLRRQGIRDGEQCAYLLARAVAEQGYRVIVIGDDSARVVGRSGLIPARNMAEAAELAEAFVGSRPYALVMPRGRWLTPSYKATQWQNAIDGRDGIEDTRWSVRQIGADQDLDGDFDSLLPESGIYSEN